MKARFAAILCTAALLILSVACGDKDNTVVSEAGEGGQALPRTEATTDSAKTETPITNGIEGNYVAVPFSYMDSSDFYDKLVLDCAVQLDDVLVLEWQLNDELTGPTLVEALDTLTGANLHRHTAERYAYALEEAEDNSDEYRLLLEDRVTYYPVSAEDEKQSFLLPVKILGTLWQSYTFSSPYDYDKQRGLWAYTAEDGIYTAGQDASDERLVLKNTLLVDIAASLTNKLPEHLDSQLHFVDPIFTGGGRYIVASACLLPDGKAPIYFGVSYVDLTTGNVTHIENSESITAAAKRMDSERIILFGASGEAVDGIEFVQAVEKGDNALSWDYNTYLKVEKGEDESGDTIVKLVQYNATTPDWHTSLLSARVEEIELMAVTESTALCLLSGEGSSQLVIVPYSRSISENSGN